MPFLGFAQNTGADQAGVGDCASGKKKSSIMAQSAKIIRQAYRQAVPPPLVLSAKIAGGLLAM